MLNNNPNNKENIQCYYCSIGGMPCEKHSTPPVEKKCCELCEGNHRLFKSKEARVDCKCHIPQSNTMEDLREEFANKYFLGTTEFTDTVINWWLEKLSQVRKETIREMKEKIDDYILNVINKSSFTYETLVAKQNTAKDVINLLSKDIEQ